MAEKKLSRTFKTAWFSRAARKALIADKELCDALEQVRQGQCDDLGGGVFKKRLDKIDTAASFSPKVSGIGFTSTCSPRRTGATSQMTSWPASVDWQRGMRV